MRAFVAFFLASLSLQAFAVLTPVGGSSARTVPVGGYVNDLTYRVTTDGGAPVAGASIRYYRPLYGAASTWSSIGNEACIPDMGITCYLSTDADGYVTIPAFKVEHPGFSANNNYIAVWAEGRPNDFRTPLGSDYAIITAIDGPHGASRYQDIWWGGPAQNGWGMTVMQHGESMFVTIFAYDDAGRPAWWFMPEGTWIGDVLSGKIYSPSGSSYRQYDPAAFRLGSAVGSATIDFSQPAASMRVQVGANVVTRRIERFNFEDGPATVATGAFSDMWFDPAKGNGSGLAIIHKPDRMFGVWFTYGDDGRPTWFVMPDAAGKNATGQFAGTLFRTQGSAWLTGSYDPARLATEPVGDFSLSVGSDRATWSLNAPSIGASVRWNAERLTF